MSDFESLVPIAITKDGRLTVETMQLMRMRLELMMEDAIEQAMARLASKHYRRGERLERGVMIRVTLHGRVGE